ncbi:MAG: DinB family protein [Ferruginibacter sp.]
MQNQFVSDMEMAIDDFLKTLSFFDASQINQVYFDDRWTAAQVADHVLKSLENIPRVLSGESIISDRDVFLHVSTIKSIFLDYTNKMQSPEFILPSNDPLDIKLLSDKLSAVKGELTNVSTNTDLSLLFTGFKFPGMGELSGYEWICFAACHTTRHCRQLKNIYAIVNKNEFMGSGL